MKTLATFTDAGWDCSNIWAMDATTYAINDGYPSLRCFNPAGFYHIIPNPNGSATVIFLE